MNIQTLRSAIQKYKDTKGGRNRVVFWCKTCGEIGNKEIDFILDEVIQKARQKAIRECIEELKKYFEGVIAMPDPQASWKKINQNLKKLLEKYD